MKTEIKNKLILFLKGLLMGICDLIPGISGGTIALITGIYYKLIYSISNISFSAFINLLNYLINRNQENEKKIKEDLKKIDFIFLISLGLGIATAIVFGSKAITFLLDNYFTYTIAFFSGLIIASSKVIYDDIKNHNMKNIIFGSVGFIIGASFIFLVPVNADPSYAYLFVGGFFAVSAMFLPGISGAFILLILGLYEFMIKKVFTDIPGHLDYFIVSSAGALIGMLTISRIISFLFKKDKCKTLYVLLGLVLGSLIIPLNRIYAETSELTITNLSLLMLFFALGAGIILITSKIKNKNKK